MQWIRPALVLALALALGTVAAADDESPAVRLVALRKLDAGNGIVRSLAWSPDGTQLAAGCSDRTLRIWDPGASAPRATETVPRYG